METRYILSHCYPLHLLTVSHNLTVA